MNRFDYYRAVLLGVVLGMSSLTLVYMISVAMDVKEPQTQTKTPKSNFTVVDKYKDCDVLQWSSYGGFAEYKYFLHCSK